tara:strand:- start:14 stop:811 length:798 start_codon:yes stop_codon:yes gene_type:complete
MSSFFAAKRVKEKHGNENLKLLFTDTKYEDEDLYRFLREGAEYLGGDLVWIEEGRDPWEVFKDVRFLGNSRIDPCSRVLKRDLAKKWVHENYPDPSTAILYLGMNWDEGHRLERSQRFWAPYQVESPLMEKPWLERRLMMSELDHLGIFPPRLYEMGFPHNNCGGFCIKAGQAHFRLLLRELPEKYAEVEQKEEEMRQLLDKDVSILKDRRGGTTKPLTLKEFRNRETKDCDLFEWGGCGCFGDFEDEELNTGGGNEESTDPKDS